MHPCPTTRPGREAVLRLPYVARNLCDTVGQTLRVEAKLKRITGFHRLGHGKEPGQAGGIVERVERS